MANLLCSLADSFDAELGEKEKNLNQAHALLANIQAEILEGQRTVVASKTQAAASKERLTKLQSDLETKMGKRYRFGWEKWLMDEEEREALVRGESMTSGDSTSTKRKATDDISDLEKAGLYCNWEGWHWEGSTLSI
jgi:hypothetical protein